ncbi:MAG TPA: cation:proton antiporter family protein [Patescibacteria group bacterium]|nr:cation:proton antiporter family protein [Patescibacteria group bacterium]
MELFIEMTLIVVLAAVVSFVMRLLKQPLVVGYIFTGILVGPYALDILHATEHVELFSKIGITVLLFIVGLHLSPKVIQEVGKVSLVTGVGQVLLTSLVGFFIALFLGIEKIAALYIAIALTFSSTIIILKLLSDRGDLNKLYGRISIGFLIVQDIIAALILLFVSAFANAANVNIVLLAGFLLAKMLIVLVWLYLISSYVIPRLMKYVARSSELLFLFSLAWGLGLASMFSTIGLSVEIGALIAGVILSLTPYAYEIGSRLRPLRDFFILLFFILLGSQMVLDQVQDLIIPAIVLSLFVLIGNPVIMVILMNLLGFKKKTGFMAGLTVAQISEFSLILASLGFNSGHIPRDILSLITMVGLITIAGSTYFIMYADDIYPHVERLLRYLQLIKVKRDDTITEAEYYEMILFGFDRVGLDFIEAFKKFNRSYLVVDFNPASIKRLIDHAISYRFGDAEDIEFLEELGLSKVKLVVSSIPDHKTNVLLARTLKKINPRAIVITIGHTNAQARELYREGVTYVIMPHYLGARHVTRMMARYGLDKSLYKEEQQKHIDFIQKRMQLL